MGEPLYYSEAEFFHEIRQLALALCNCYNVLTGELMEIFGGEIPELNAIEYLLSTVGNESVFITEKEIQLGIEFSEKYKIHWQTVLALIEIVNMVKEKEMWP